LIEEILLDELYRAYKGIKRNYYFIEEVAAILELDKQNIYYLARTGEIPAIKIGHWYLIPCSWIDDLFEYIEKQMKDTNTDEVFRKILKHMWASRLIKYKEKEKETK